ncbi:hypothetical protein OC834_007192, partial [Tilletia horrida]
MFERALPVTPPGMTTSVAHELAELHDQFSDEMFMKIERLVAAMDSEPSPQEMLRL